MGNPTLQELPQKDTWQTPEWLVNGLNDHLGVDLDPCAGPDTDIAKTNWSITRGQDGLERAWGGVGFETVYVNPPFSEKDLWVQKVGFEARDACSSNPKQVVLLTPDATDVQSWWHGERGSEYGVIDADYVWFSRGRVSFVDPETGEQTGTSPNGIALSLWGAFPEVFLEWLDGRGWLVNEVET